MNKHIQNNPELERIIKSGNKEELINYLSSNPKLAELMLNDIANLNKTPSEKYRLDAIDKIYDDKDFIGAIELINTGLELNDKEYEHDWYKLRSQCQIELMNHTDALVDINKAIQSIIQHSPAEYGRICEYIDSRSEIKLLLRDIEGAKKDKLEALNVITTGIQFLRQNSSDDYGTLSAYLYSRSEIKTFLQDFEGAKHDKILSEEYELKFKSLNPDCDDLPF
jgi:hypothetical protein